MTNTNVPAKDAATGDFNHCLISRTNALSAQDKLVANLELVTKLHELYRAHRDRGKDEASEEELITKDKEYISKLDLKAQKAMDQSWEKFKNVQTRTFASFKMSSKLG